MARYVFTVDGAEHEVDVADDTPLLYVLQGELGLKGPKYGCGVAQCGACTVIVNGTAARSCTMPVSAADGQAIRTLDGLGTPERPHPVQSAFVAEEAAQCGYCTNGWIMTAVAGLERNPSPDEAGIREMLAGLKCRCGAHMAMLRAVRRTAGRGEG
jgi:nicotinate dehydrogenase subunit A